MVYLLLNEIFAIQSLPSFKSFLSLKVSIFFKTVNLIEQVLKYE